ncbi:MAG: paraquat-inducible protein A [Planctomycetota bacterium]|nr:paraquat-inducible protein A [Planctomycetota bacterium]
MPTDLDTTDLKACGTCGQIQRVPPLEGRQRAHCSRCQGVVARAAGAPRRLGDLGGNHWTVATALGALILYPLAIGLPFMSVERMGHHHSASILESSVEMLRRGDLVVGLVVFLCSVVLPLGKLTGLLAISTSRSWMKRKHRALTYHIVELSGRWGMIDVLLAAILIAMLKLGDLVTVEPGPGLLAFASCVTLSLIAGASFDPHALWETE